MTLLLAGFFRPFRWIRVHSGVSGGTNPLNAHASTRHHPQIAHPHQVVSRKSQDKLKIQLLATYKWALAQAANRLQPAKALLNSLALRLADAVSLMAGGCQATPRFTR